VVGMQRWAQSSNNTCAVEVLQMVEAQSSFCHIALSCKEIAQILQVTALGPHCMWELQQPLLHPDRLFCTLFRLFMCPQVQIDIPGAS